MTRLPGPVDARALVAARVGLDFPERRRADLERGVKQAALALGISEARLVASLAALPTASREWQELASALTVGESYFFRDRSIHDALERSILPELIAERRARGVRQLRIWSAGCATGEEPYSLAMLLDRLLPDRYEWTLTILGTDLDERALEAARRGVYQEWSLRDTPPAERTRYFRAAGKGKLELAQPIRDMVRFAQVNLAADGFPDSATGEMDLILCRNVVMYFTADARDRAVRRLHGCLAERGWLVLGPAETTAELMRPLTARTFGGCILHRSGPPPAPEPPAPQTPALATAQPAPRPAAAPSTPAAEAARHLRRAREEADQGNLDRAGALCDAALGEDRLNVEAHLLAAAIHQERGRIDAALAACRSAVFLAPDSAAAHFLLGSLLSRKGSDASARHAMATVARLLSAVPDDEPLPGGEGLIAGRVRASARGYLEPAS